MQSNLLTSRKSNPPVLAASNAADASGGNVSVELLCGLLIRGGGDGPPPQLSAGEWGALLTLAERHGVGPLLFYALRDLAGQIPPAVYAHLQRDYYNTAAHTALLMSELERVLTALEAAGIPALVLKGAYLAQALYPEPGLRPMGDLDLLIHPHDRETALAVAAALDYHPAEIEIVPGLEANMMHTTLLLGGPAGRIGLELHWNLLAGLADQRTVPADWMWRTAEAFNGWRCPNPSAHLLYLTAHQALRHPEMVRLLWLYDIHLVLTRQGERLDWADLLSQARTLGWLDGFAGVLREVTVLFSSPVPDPVWQHLPTGVVFSLSGGGPATRSAATWAALRKLSLLARLQVIWALVFPAPAYMRWRYRNLARWPLIARYPYRWFDILRDLWKTVF